MVEIFIKDCSDEDYRMYLITQRMLKWINGGQAPPFQLNLYFTKRCNLGCKFCYYSGIDGEVPQTELSAEMMKRLAEEGTDMGIDFWYLGGGEPFTAPDKLLPLMETIKKRGKYGNVNTNGTLFTEEIAKKLVDIGWDEITISVNSAEAKYDDEIRGKQGVFDRCVKGIELLQRIKEQHNKNRKIIVEGVSLTETDLSGQDFREIGLTKKYEREVPAMKPFVHIHTVITNKNYNNLTGIVELGHRLNVTSINFTHLMDDTGYAKSLKLTQEQAEECKKEAGRALKLAEKYKLFTNLSAYTDSPINTSIGNYYDHLKESSMRQDKSSLLSSICFEPWTQISVFSDGTVGLCGVWNPSRNEENIHRTSLKEIWYGERFQKIREGMKNQEQLDECGDCASSRIFKNNLIKDSLRRLEKR